MQPASTGSTNDGFPIRPKFCRSTQIILQHGTHTLTFGRMASFLYYKEDTESFPTLRQTDERIPHCRSPADSIGEPHIFSRTYPARINLLRTPSAPRAFSLWRRSRLCRRHRLGSNGRRALCRRRCLLSGIESRTANFLADIVSNDYFCRIPIAVVAQLVEHQLPKLRVTSSSLAYRSPCEGVSFFPEEGYPLAICYIHYSLSSFT